MIRWTASSPLLSKVTRLVPPSAGDVPLELVLSGGRCGDLCRRVWRLPLEPPLSFIRPWPADRRCLRAPPHRPGRSCPRGGRWSWFRSSPAGRLQSAVQLHPGGDHVAAAAKLLQHVLHRVVAVYRMNWNPWGAFPSLVSLRRPGRRRPTSEPCSWRSPCSEMLIFSVSLNRCRCPRTRWPGATRRRSDRRSENALPSNPCHLYSCCRGIRMTRTAIAGTLSVSRRSIRRGRRSTSSILERISERSDRTGISRRAGRASQRICLWHPS